MSNRDKTPAVYVWINTVNGKQYVGSTKDIGQRGRQYLCDYNRIVNKGFDIEDLDSNHCLMEDMVKYGWDAFRFKIIDGGETMFDPMERSMREIEEIMNRRTLLPEFGYNSTLGGESGTVVRRKGPASSKPRDIIKYDTTENSVELYLRGSLTMAESLGIKQNSFIDAVVSGQLVKGRYILYYANTEKRDFVYKFVRRNRDVVKMNGNNDTVARQRWEQYKAGYELASALAKKWGY